MSAADCISAHTLVSDLPLAAQPDPDVSARRMDHLPFVLQQTKGAEGFVFHGGATDDNGHWDQARAYLTC